MPSSRIPVAAQPFPWDRLLAYFSLRATPGLESVDNGVYARRTAQGLASASYDAGAACLNISDIAHSARFRKMFDVDCDVSAVARTLLRCPILGPRIRQSPGLRIPGCWEPFELCVRAVLGQQVSVKAACGLMAQLGAICPAYDASSIAEADLSSLRMPRRRIQTVALLARAAASGALQFEDWKRTAVELAEIPGIGPWTIHYLAIRLGRDPDALPETDIGLLRTASCTPRELLKLAERWRPYRAYGAMYLWMTGAPQ